MQWLAELRTRLLPGRCMICAGQAESLVCAGCHAELPWNDTACPLCARPLAAASGAACSECAAEPPANAAALSAFRHDWPVSAAVHRLKYHADFRCARWLGEALAQARAAKPDPLPQLLLPVPLHAGRLRRRGYNQAQELARAVAGVSGIRLEPTAARRLRPTEDQIGKTAAQRRRNLKGAFAVDAARVAGLHVALIDDVMTTGSTLAELTRTCLAAGALRVEVWTATRAVLRKDGT